MSRIKSEFVTYERGYSGEYIIYVNGKRDCTVDNYREYIAARNEILNRNILCQLA